MAVYLVIVAGGRAVIRRKFSASRWIDHVRDLRHRHQLGVDDGLRLEAGCRARTTATTGSGPWYAAPTASTIVDQFTERYGIEAFLDAFGLTRRVRRSCRPTGAAPAGAAGLQNAEWFDIRLVDLETDREVPVGQVGELVAVPVHPWTRSNGYYAREDRRGLAEPLVPHRRRAAP